MIWAEVVPGLLGWKPGEKPTWHIVSLDISTKIHQKCYFFSRVRIMYYFRNWLEKNFLLKIMSRFQSWLTNHTNNREYWKILWWFRRKGKFLFDVDIPNRIIVLKAWSFIKKMLILFFGIQLRFQAYETQI